MRLVDGRGRRAPVDRGEPARVAMGENVEPRPRPLARREFAQDRQPMIANGAVDGDILLGERVRGRERGGFPRGGRQGSQDRRHALDRPGEIDGCWPRRGQSRRGLGEPRVGGVGAHGQRHAIRRRRADERRATHPHVTDGVDGVVEGFEAACREPMRQQRLIDDDDGTTIRVEKNAAARLPVHQHATRLRWRRRDLAERRARRQARLVENLATRAMIG